MTTDIEDTRLADRPHRGLRQTMIATAGFVVVTAALWCIWAAIAHHRLQSQIDAIVALHQPFYPDDFKMPHVPDEQNAALLWQAALDALPADTKSPASSNLEYHEYPPYPAAWHALEDQSIQLNRSVFDLAKKASIATEAEWSTGLSLMAYIPVYNHSREVANVLGDSMIYHHEHHEDAIAIERGIEIMRLAQCEKKIGDAVARLVSTGLEALTCLRIMAIAPDLEIRDAPEATSRASVEQIRQLIGLLLDESDRIAASQRMIDIGRMEGHQRSSAERKIRWALLPLLDLAEARTLKSRTVDRRAAEATSQFQAQQIYAGSPQPMISVSPNSLISGTPTRSELLDWCAVFDNAEYQSRAIETIWKGIAERRVTATALAIQLYRHDHHRWPATLNELVPAYLPAIPADPFKTDRVQIGYVIRKQGLPDGQDRPMLYFNLEGDPNTALLPTTPVFSWDRDSAQWRDLARWAPAPVPSPQSPGTPPALLPAIR